jgi:hypothetical protein
MKKEGGIEVFLGLGLSLRQTASCTKKDQDQENHIITLPPACYRICGCLEGPCHLTNGLVPYIRTAGQASLVKMNVSNTDAADGPQKTCCAQFCECLKWSWCLFKFPFFLVFFILAVVLGLLGLVLGIVLLPLRCVASG